MEFQILGSLSVTVDGRAVEVSGSRPRALLALLLLHPGRVLPADRLVDELWGEDPPAHAANALQAAASRLRRALDQGRAAGAAATPGSGPGPANAAPARLLVARGPGYVLEVAPESVDAVRFERLAATGRRALAEGDPRRASEALRDALGLWRGPALADFTEERFAEGERARLEELRLAGLEDRIEADLQLGEHGALVGELRALVAAAPLRERPRGQLMRALYRSGRQAEALELYDSTRRALAEELGLDPSPELQRLQRAMLAHDPALGAAPEAAAADAAPAGPGPAPAPARPAGPGSPGNLPARLTSFVGMVGEVARVRELLDRGRLLTLTGPGGVGKTRLAVEATAGLARRVPDGVWLVELAPLRQPAALAQTVLSAIGAREGVRLGQVGAPHGDDRERLLEVLATARPLLLLDNCEHLVAAVAELVEAVLAACPGVLVLATSREALRVPGELLYEVPPLRVPPAEPAAEAPPAPDALMRHGAVRLLYERARAIRPSFEITAGNAAAVAEVCRRLDGIPLAIELAAARLRTLPVAQVAVRLDDRFRLLTGGSRTALPRQRTLRAVMDWSWGLLDPAEQAVLRRLAVFAGGCTLEAAERVCAGRGVEPGEVLDRLGGLVDKSLVAAGEAGGAARYRLLETVRAYAAERLAEAGESTLAGDAHAAYFMELAEAAAPELRGRRQLDWIERLEAEHDNLRAALAWALQCGQARTALRLAGALGWFWWVRGYREEGPRWLGAALDLAGPEPTPERAAALTWRGFWWSADLTDLQRYAEAALAAHRRLGDEHGAVLPTLLLAALARNRGELAASAERMEAALAALGDGADPWLLGLALVFHGGMHLADGDLDGAADRFRGAGERFDEVGERWGRAIVRHALAVVHEIRGQHGQAMALLEEAMALSFELGSREAASDAMVKLGIQLIYLGDLPGARRRLQESLELGERLNLPSSVNAAVYGLGMVARREGRLAEARAHLERALDFYRRLRLLTVVASILAELGFLAELEGDAELAWRLHTDSLAAARDGGDPRGVALALDGLAGAAAVAGDGERAARLLGAAEAIREGAGGRLPPSERADRDRAAANAKARLRPARFEAALAQGGTLTLDEAVTEAEGG